jgi:hypothetical protein
MPNNRKCRIFILYTARHSTQHKNGAISSTKQDYFWKVGDEWNTRWVCCCLLLLLLLLLLSYRLILHNGTHFSKQRRFGKLYSRILEEQLLFLLYVKSWKRMQAALKRMWLRNAQRCLTRFLLGILLLEPCISLIYAWITNECNNY